MRYLIGPTMSPGAPRIPGRRNRQSLSKQYQCCARCFPHTDRLLPLLRRIDATRIYTNWAIASASELERRLSDHFGLVEGSVVSASSGTAALVGAILAMAGRATTERPFAIVPVHLRRDSNRSPWSSVVTRLLSSTSIPTRGCSTSIDSQPIPVSARRASSCRFRHLAGRSTGSVVAFRAGTGIPVVIDGAASFERLSDEPQRWIGDVPDLAEFSCDQDLRHRRRRRRGHHRSATCERRD